MATSRMFPTPLPPLHPRLSKTLARIHAAWLAGMTVEEAVPFIGTVEHGGLCSPASLRNIFEIMDREASCDDGRV